MLISNEKTSPTFEQKSINDKTISCHMPNYNDDEKYYSAVKGTIKSKANEECKKECHTACTICWSEDNCVPVCQIAKEYDLEGFAPVECSRPFYFCNAGLSVNTYSGEGDKKDDKGNPIKEKKTFPFHGKLYF